MSMYKITNIISGNKFTLNKGQTVLDAALQHGINMPFGCQKGICGKCKALIINGEIEKKELTDGISKLDAKDGFALMCQCNPTTNLDIAIDELTSTSDIVSKVYPCKVLSIKLLNADVAEVILKIPSADFIQFLSGQYIDLIHPNFKPRSFSIANIPNNNNIIELHIRLVDNGKFTHFIFKELAEQDLLKLEGPKGSFYLRESNKPIIMLAGGTGFGPIKSMVEHILVNKQRTIKLYWGVRGQKDIYSKEPFKWAKKYSYIEFIPVLSDADKAWNGRVGYVHNAVLEDFDDLSKYEVYACGNPTMVKIAAESFIKIGLNKQNFYSDAFEFQEH